MNEYALLHIPESKYCYATNKNKISLRLRTAREDHPTVKVIYGGKYSYALHREQAEMTRMYEDRLYAYYTVSARSQHSPVRYIECLTIIDI